MAPSRGQPLSRPRELCHVRTQTRGVAIRRLCRRHLPHSLLLFVASVLLVIYLREEPLPTGPPFLVNTTAYLLPPRGRAKHDGAWVALRKPVQVYAYTAFFDDRRSLGTLPVVRVIAALEKGQKGLMCMVWFEDDEPPLVVRAQPEAIGAGVARAAGHFTEYVVGCPLDSENIPISVSLVYDVNSAPAFKLPVEVPERIFPRHDFVVCVSVSYWRHDPHSLVEWMEMLRLLGVHKVTVYNNSLATEAVRVLQYYDNTGFVELRQAHSFLSEFGEFTIHLLMSPVINDCVYRNMYKYRKVIITDLDEIIVPRMQKNYLSLLEAVEKETDIKHPARTYIFRNAYFFTDILGEDKNETIFLKTQRYRRRLPPSKPGYSVKSIMDPLACVAMHNHFCWSHTRLYDRPGRSVEVAPELALNQHYKRCHLPNCNELANQGVSDDVMVTYRAQLSQAVTPVLQRLGLEPLESGRG